MSTQPKPVRVFVNYRHDSAMHAERVLALADRLRRDVLDAWIEQYEPKDGWPRLRSGLTVRFGDYREVGSILMPYSIEQLLSPP